MVQAIDDVVNTLAQFVELTPCPKESSESIDRRKKVASIHKVFMYKNGRGEQAKVGVDYNRLTAIFKPLVLTHIVGHYEGYYISHFQERIEEFDPFILGPLLKDLMQDLDTIDALLISLPKFVYHHTIHCIEQILRSLHKPSKLPAVDSAFEESVDIHLLDINQFCDPRIITYIEANRNNISYVEVDSVPPIEEAEKMKVEQDFHGLLKLADQKLAEGYAGLLSLSISFKNPEVIPCIDYSKNKNCFTVSAAPIFHSGSFEFVKHLMRSNVR